MPEDKEQALLNFWKASRKFLFDSRHGLDVIDLKRVLITGFEPFGDHDTNPAGEVIESIDDKGYEDFDIFIHHVPTVYGEAIVEVVEKIDELEPDVVINIGLAERKKISLERVAVNIDDARIPDNDENQPQDEVISPDGKNAYFSKLPLREILERLHDEGIPAKISNSAGTFVCNNLMYGVLDHISKNDLDIKAGFIHIPQKPEEVVDQQKPSMCLHLVERAVEIAVETSLE